MFWVRSDLDSAKTIRVFNFQGGVFWERSDLDSVKNFNFGGCSGKGRTWTLGRISIRGVFWNQIPEQGCSGEFGQNFWKPSLLVHHR